MRTRNPFVPAAIVAALTIGSLAACSSGGNTNYVTSHTPGVVLVRYGGLRLGLRRPEVGGAPVRLPEG